MDSTNRTSNSNNTVAANKSSRKTTTSFNKNNSESIEEEPGGKIPDTDDLNDDNDVVILEEYSNKKVSKKEKSRMARQEKMNLDAAIFADFDLTATRKNELISCKFSDTFKSVLEDFTATNKLKSDERKSFANTLETEQLLKNDSLNSFKLNLNFTSSKETKISEAGGIEDKRMNMWANKINNPVLKSKLKLLTDISGKNTQESNSKESTSVKKLEPARIINNPPSQSRPKTAASISNSSIMSMKFGKPPKSGSQNKNNDFVSKRPTSTKSEFGIHASSLLFDGYEKCTKNESHHSELYDDDVSNQYISPSFRIKKYNLDDENELEKAKKDLFKRYAVFKDMSTNQRPKSHRIIRFASSSRNNLVASSATIRTY